MTNLQIQDPWFEGIFKAEFHGNPEEFLQKFKTLLLQERDREKRIKGLLKKYEEGEISVARIAEKLDMEREDVWKLMEEHHVYLIDKDYDLNADTQTAEKYLINN